MGGRWAHWRQVVEALPGVRQWRQRRFDRAFEAGQAIGCCRGVFETQAQATATAPRTRPLGYDHVDAAEMYRDRLERVYPSDYPMALWLQRALSEGARRVVDLGGHVGVAYHAYPRRLLQWPDDLRWHVVDVPAVVASGRELARARGCETRLSFGEHFEAADGADLLFSSGCLQYLDGGLAERLSALRQPPRWVLVNLLPLHPQHSYWTLQSIGTAFCPYHVRAEPGFFNEMAALGYELMDRWENLEKECWVAFDPAHSLKHYHGAAFRRVAAG